MNHPAVVDSDTSLLRLRRRWLSKPLLAWYRRLLPPMSATERDALDAGSVWWDGQLFSGNPDWSAWLAVAAPQLSAEEAAFMDGPVEELCRMVEDWEIQQARDLPPRVWRFIRERGFFGMIIPKEYGGLGFSALAHSTAVMKIATRSLSTAVTVMVPNSLGPAELLLHYGTDAQKNHYLPRLARGQELPCFALTGPWSGSDAASMPDHGVVCEGEHEGERVLGIRVSFDKRYITLAPVATVLGLAFRLSDPDGLLGDERDLGITLALIPTDTPGVEIGRRHLPANQAFQNGPVRGKDVFIPLARVIGGRDGVGQGWRMLMDCLAAGRSISLPATGTAGAKFCARTTGNYARIRKQFKLPIGRFEGIEEPLARIAGHAYVLDAARRITASAVDAGEKPSVLSAIVKYHFTERMRALVNDAMDVHGGKGVCEGPGNYLATGYQGIPIVITVEGANILTRSMMIFGQGAIRCHPFLRREMAAASDPDQRRGLVEFDRALFGHLGFTLKNLGRTLWWNLTGGRFIKAPAGPTQGYFRDLSRASAGFALAADLTMMLLGGALKRREKLSARLGDILSELYLTSCVLKRFHDDGQPMADLPLLHWAARTGLDTIQSRFDEILANYPSKPVAFLLRRVLFPFGLRRRPALDRLGSQCATLLLEPSEARDRLTEYMHINRDPADVTGRLEYALEKVLAAEPIERKLRQSGHSDSKSALRAGVITELEAQLVSEAERATLAVISVDDFDPAELVRRTRGMQTPDPAVAHTG